MNKFYSILTLFLVIASVIRPAESPALARTSTTTGYQTLLHGTPPGDIWVWGGRWRVAEIEQPVPGGGTKPEQIALKLRSNRGKALTEKNPLKGDFSGRNIYVLDNTPLYFENAENIGDLYGFYKLVISSGTVAAVNLHASSEIYISSGAVLTATGEISTGRTFLCRGGSVTAGSLSARSIWLDSYEAPLFLNVSGNVFSGYYTHSGGSVTIGGALFAVHPPGSDASVMAINGEYAVHNPTSLTVSENIISAGKNAAIEIGAGSSIGLRDETAMTADYKQRMGRCPGSIYEFIPEKTTFYDDVTVIVGGEIKATGAVNIISGSVTANTR